MPVVTKKNGLVYAVNTINGKREWEPFGRGPEAVKAATVRDTEIKLARMKGTLRPGYGGPSPTFAEVCQAYINDRQSDLSGKTIDDILAAAANYADPVIGAKPISDVTFLDWTTMQGRMLANGCTNRTVNKLFNYLNPILKWAAAHQLIKDNPWRNRSSLKAAPYKVELLTTEEFGRIMAVAPDHLVWVLTVAYYTGCRPGATELFALQWDDVDWNNNSIRIRGTKTVGADRWQYFPQPVMDEMLVRMIRYRYSGNFCPYICQYEGKPIKSFKTAWHTALRTAGITRKVRPYDIRHFHITHALERGAPIQELANRVGHRDVQMIVRVYSHMVEELRTKQPFSLPEIGFSKQSVDGVLTKKAKKG